eukprot:m.133507 g.133507  ORF g.133507 m.133507 type:complete len:267 (+) comp9860_c0_seq7:65-865(+)
MDRRSSSTLSAAPRQIRSLLLWATLTSSVPSWAWHTTTAKAAWRILAPSLRTSSARWWSSARRLRRPSPPPQAPLQLLAQSLTRAVPWSRAYFRCSCCGGRGQWRRGLRSIALHQHGRNSRLSLCSTLEEHIDQLESELPPLRNFIIPSGGGIVSCRLHIARTVCRRAERTIAQIVQEEGCAATLLVYVNRLSDLLFMAARHAAMCHGCEELCYQAKRGKFVLDGSKANTPSFLAPSMSVLSSAIVPFAAGLLGGAVAVHLFSRAH